MSTAWTLKEALRARLAAERGPPFYAPGSQRVAMLYPSPYRVGMSSLGFQWISGLLADAGFSVERVFLPDDVEAWQHSKQRPVSMETHTALGNFPLIAVSVAYELELAGLIQVLELAGIPPLRADRTPGHPKILIGGPLTFSNPLPIGPFADAVLLGEADDTVVAAVEGFFDTGRFDHVADLPGGWIPATMGEQMPPVGRAADDRLPARSRIRSPDTELHDMFLLEGERGCHRGCTFCVMRRSTNGGMRLVPPEALLSYIPDDAPRVGLVGAAISDHPQLVGLLESLVAAGKGIGISSLRADRVALKPDIPRLLRAGGYKTLTVASDAASQRLRRTIMKGTTEAHLVACAEAARLHKYRTLKVYMMVGVPDEQDEDIEELITFTRQLAAIHHVALGIAPFVPKRNTPLDNAEFAGIPLVERRLARIAAGLRDVRAEVRPTSARWAWVEHKLASAGQAGGHIALQAVHAGGTFAAWKKAFKSAEEAVERPWQGWEGATA